MIGAHETADEYYARLAIEDPERWGTNYIYGLVDPDSQQIRYIGKSIRPLQRLQNHMNEVSNCYRSHWLQSLKARGLTPELVILEEVCGSWPWQEAERYWIARAKSLGWSLVNNTSGGDGVSNLPAHIRARMRLTWLGRKHSPETLERLRIARAKRVTSNETRVKMSASMRGRKVTWTDALSKAIRKFTPEQAAAIKARLDAGEKGKDLAAELHVDRTTISKIKKGTYHARYRSVRTTDAT